MTTNFHVVLHIYEGLMNQIYLYRHASSAKRRYEGLKKKYGISKKNQEFHSHEVKWYELPVKGGTVI